jgi:hypothetical protein
MLEELAMVTYNESGVELIQARGSEGKFQYRGRTVRLGIFSEDDAWYIGVHEAAGTKLARLSLEDAETIKEASDMLKYGFFLDLSQDDELFACLEEAGLFSAPGLSARAT